MPHQFGMHTIKLNLSKDQIRKTARGKQIQVAHSCKRTTFTSAHTLLCAEEVLKLTCSRQGKINYIIHLSFYLIKYIIFFTVGYNNIII